MHSDGTEVSGTLDCNQREGLKTGLEGMRMLAQQSLLLLQHLTA